MSHYADADTTAKWARIGGDIDAGMTEALDVAGYEYKVVELREGKMSGGKMSGDKLEKVLNDHARQGWQVKAITAAEVKGRIGPGGVQGVLVTFERPRA